VYGIEESYAGGNLTNNNAVAVTANTQPQYWAFGGSTGSASNSSTYAGYGYGAYVPNIGFCTMEGLYSVVNHAGANVFSDLKNTDHHMTSQSTAANGMLFQRSTVTLSTSLSTIGDYPGATITHSCWTAAVAMYLAAAPAL
jgi:hypothetical protein